MPIIGLLAVLFGAVASSGCEIATPFRGPGYDAKTGVRNEHARTLLVAVTKAELHDERSLRTRFWNHVDKVEKSLEGRPGFIGFSKRQELFGDQAWTMTVWTDEASLDAFVGSSDHQAAMAEASYLLKSARFVRFQIDRSEVPVPWASALERLAASTRQY